MKEINFEELVKSNGKKNKGLYTFRLDYDKSDMENVFSKKWSKENKNRKGFNYGHGILQDLFISHKEGFSLINTVHTEITDRDRLIVATVIQWLGTNVGRCFLEEVLEECGYEIKRHENN